MDEPNALRRWRTENGVSLTWLAQQLSVQLSTVSRWESGEHLIDADMASRIVALSGGAVSLADIYAIRLAWLKEHRPEKFARPEAAA